MFSLTTGLSALRASQTALDTIAHNVANANDPNYHRQITDLENRRGIERQGFLIGNGVDVAAVRRLHNDRVALAITDNVSTQTANAARLDIARQVEAALSPHVGSLDTRLNSFLNGLESLTSSPHDDTARRTVIQSAQALTQEFNTVTEQFATFDRLLAAELSDLVSEVNRRAGEIVQLNRTIAEHEHQGSSPNDLLDTRDRLIGELSELIDVRLEHQSNGASILLLGDHGLAGHSFAPLEVAMQDGLVQIKQSGDRTPLEIRGGRLAGLISGKDAITGTFQQRLDALANQLVAAINRAHSQGVGLSGAFHQLRGTVAVQNASVALAQLNTPFDITAGSLFVSVRNEATGERTMTEVAVDPQLQSLNDVAAAIASVDHLSAFVDGVTGNLIVRAETGFAFDFTPSTASRPQIQSITGSASPQLHGAFTGAANESISFSVPTAGTVGVSPGLTVEVRNAAGDLITTLDVGAGYEAGTPVEIADGISVSFSVGDFNAGDSFATTLVAEPDTTGLLVALGLNGLLVGHDAATIGVNSAIVEDADLLATTRSGEPGDISNLKSLIAVRNQMQFGPGNTSATAEMEALVAAAGFEVQQLSQIEDQLSLAREQLDAQRNALSGVDPNEELVYMLQFQRAFQVASRLISTVDETLADLLAIVG